LQQSQTEIVTRPRPPESNALVERLNGTVRNEMHDDGASCFLAEASIARLMQH
jgi:transposase